MEYNIWKSNPLSFWRSAILVLNYFVGFLGVYPVVITKLTLWINPSAKAIPIYFQFSIYFLMILISVVVGWPVLKESYQRLLYKKDTFFKNSFKLLGVFYVCTFVLNIVLMFVTDTETSANQIEVINSIRLNPILMIFSTCVYAPIVEEIVFRGVFFRSVRRSKSFIVAAFVSSFSFGFLHVLNSLVSGDFNDLWYVFSYALIGFFLSYAYEKNESIFASMFLHLLNNGIAFLLLLL